VIEVNLLPRSGRSKRKKAQRPARPGPGFKLPKFPRLGGDLSGIPGGRWGAAAAVLSALSLASIGFLYTQVAGEAEELQVRLQAARSDSIQYADVIQRAERLQAQRDSVAQRVAVLQDIDEARYVWPHILDEVGRALPAYTWLTSLQQIAAVPKPLVRIRGRAATYLALTGFMENLEDSPYLGAVRLVGSDPILVPGPGGAQRRVYDYTLEVRYEDPPAELVERVPLFLGTSISDPQDTLSEDP
jgi:hypothetical protein